MDSSPGIPLVVSSITGDPTPNNSHPKIPTPVTPQIISLRLVPVAVHHTPASSACFPPNTQFSLILRPVSGNPAIGPSSAVVAPIVEPHHMVAPVSPNQRDEATLKTNKQAQYPWLKSCRLIGYEKSCPLVQVLDGDLGRTGGTANECHYDLQEKSTSCKKRGRPRKAGSNSPKTSKTMPDGTVKKRGRPRKAGSNSDRNGSQQTEEIAGNGIPDVSELESEMAGNSSVNQLGDGGEADPTSDITGFQQHGETTATTIIPEILTSKSAPDDSPPAPSFDSRILGFITLEDVMDVEKGDGPHTEAYRTYIQKCRETFESAYNCNDPDNVRKMVKWLSEQALSYKGLWEEHRNGIAAGADGDGNEGFVENALMDVNHVDTLPVSSAEPSQLEEAVENECQPSGQVKKKRGRPATQDRKDDDKSTQTAPNTDYMTAEKIANRKKRAEQKRFLRMHRKTETATKTFEATFNCSFPDCAYSSRYIGRVKRHEQMHVDIPVDESSTSQELCARRKKWAAHMRLYRLRRKIRVNAVKTAAGSSMISHVNEEPCVKGEEYPVSKKKKLKKRKGKHLNHGSDDEITPVEPMLITIRHADNVDRPELVLVSSTAVIRMQPLSSSAEDQSDSYVCTITRPDNPSLGELSPATLLSKMDTIVALDDQDIAFLPDNELERVEMGAMAALAQQGDIALSHDNELVHAEIPGMAAPDLQENIGLPQDDDIEDMEMPIVAAPDQSGIAFPDNVELEHIAETEGFETSLVYGDGVTPLEEEGTEFSDEVVVADMSERELRQYRREQIKEQITLRKSERKIARLLTLQTSFSGKPESSSLQSTPVKRKRARLVEPCAGNEGRALLEEESADKDTEIVQVGEDVQDEMAKDKPATEYRFSCDFPGCDYGAQYRYKIEYHKVIHTDGKTFVCAVPGCEYSTRKQRNFDCHEKIHTRPDLHSCTHARCHFQSKTAETLARHQLRHTAAKVYKCSFPGCQHSTRYPEYLKSHERIHKGLFAKIPSWLKKVTINGEAPSDIIRPNPDMIDTEFGPKEVSFAQPEIDLGLATRTQFARPLRRLTKKPKQRTRNPELVRVWRARYKLKARGLPHDDAAVAAQMARAARRVVVRASTDPYTCAICGKVFKARKPFGRHMNIEHNSPIPDQLKQNLRVPCDLCEHLAPTSAALGLHKRVAHGVQRPVQLAHDCVVCLKPFSHKIELGKHQNTHRNADGLLPCRYCPKTSRDSNYLKTHVAEKHKEQDAADRANRMPDPEPDPAALVTDFQCFACQRYYGSRYLMKRHIAEAHQDVPEPTRRRQRSHQTCRTCGSVFRTKSELAEHSQGTCVQQASSTDDGTSGEVRTSQGTTVSRRRRTGAIKYMDDPDTSEGEEMSTNEADTSHGETSSDDDSAGDSDLN